MKHRVYTGSIFGLKYGFIVLPRENTFSYMLGNYVRIRRTPRKWYYDAKWAFLRKRDALGLKLFHALQYVSERLPVTFITAYEVTQSYGGAEEGGWWYHNRRALKTRLAFTKAGTERARAKLEAEFQAETNSYGEGIKVLASSTYREFEYLGRPRYE